MPVLPLISKDPQSIESQGWDWDSDRFLTRLSVSETITASTWAYTGADAALTLSSPTILAGSKQTKVTMAGGTVGLEYRVTNHVTTSGGSQFDRSFIVLMEQQ